jgi:hypothetical protein
MGVKDSEVHKIDNKTFLKYTNSIENIFHSFIFQSVSATSTSAAPVFDSGDRTRVELERNKPAIKYFQTLLVDVLQVRLFLFLNP